MSTKTIAKQLLFVVILTALVLSGCSPAQNKTKSDDIRKVADKIAAYSLPEGYSEQFAVDLLGYQMVSLVGPTPNCHIYLVQAPKDVEIDIAELQAQARNMEGSKNSDRPRDVHTVETRTMTVRGQEVPVVVGEGTNSEEKAYREVTTLLEGRGGPALISIASPTDQWDWDLVNSFLASIE